MAIILRRLVSTNKRRYQQDGYDLDLSYITPRIIAMGFPCNGVSRLYRNPMNEVVRLMDERHMGHYKVYNLCVEKGYDSAVFKGRVMRVPMYDGQAPPLHLVIEVCRDAAAWLAGDPRHVVAVHCKAGKGRTGAVVCALMLALDPDLGPSSLGRILDLWAERRTLDRKGLSIPSQRRYVGYFHQLLLTAHNFCPAADQLTGAQALQEGVAKTGVPYLSGVSDQLATENGFNGICLDGKDRATACGVESPQYEAAVDTNATTHPNPYPQQDQDPTNQPGGIPLVLPAIDVPQRPVKLLRLRFRGLPPWLLQDCTVSMWWRPVGHHEPQPLCHVHTRSEPGCAGCFSPADAVHCTPKSKAPGIVNWAIHPQHVGAANSSSGSNSSNSLSGSSGGHAQGLQQELVMDVTVLPQMPPPSPPAALPYYSLSVHPRYSQPTAACPTTTTTINTTATTTTVATADSTGYTAKVSQSAAGTGTLTASNLMAALDAPSQTLSPNVAPAELDRADDCRQSAAVGKSCVTTSHVRTGLGPPVLSGDIKIQVFRGSITDPPHDVFKGSVTQFTAWICTSFLESGAGVLELHRRELDKLSKQLRRWRAPLSVVLEYESCT